MARSNARYVKSYKLSVGRRLVSLLAMLGAARRFNDAEIEVQAEEAIAHDRSVRTLLTVWQRDRKGSHGTRPEAVRIDNQLDRAMSACHGHTRNILRSMDAEEPVAIVAREFDEAFFTDGPGAITGLQFEDQLAAVEELIARWRSPAWQDKIAMLGLEMFVSRVEALVGPYREAIQNPTSRTITWSKLRAADHDGQENLLAVVARIVGTWGKASEEHVERRLAYLAVFNDQNERIASYRRRRRKAPDIDPDTGRELIEDDINLDEPVDA
ncbi:MAG: hypothetical protein H0U74_19300 [Bradymonadaceae bacterium]|nr:hypothetical protein [Lujinxingiaceae bacterium]